MNFAVWLDMDRFSVAQRKHFLPEKLRKGISLEKIEKWISLLLSPEPINRANEP